MRAPLIALMLASIALPAAADYVGFNDAQNAGDWLGCVAQPGFDPYPITLTPLEDGRMRVVYPGLCEGTHTPLPEDGFDAVEQITSPMGNCVSVAQVTYGTAADGSLRLDFWWSGVDTPKAAAPMARARLVRKRAHISAPVCNPQDAIS